MVSPELIRRYTLFADLSMEQIVELSQLADEVSVDAGHTFFREGDDLDALFIVLDGEVATVVELIEKGKPAVIAELTARERDVVISTIGHGEVFAWSSLIPPYQATATVKAITPCRVLTLDCVDLRERFEDEPRFGYLLMRRAAEGMRDRLRDMRIEALAYAAE